MSAYEEENVSDFNDVDQLTWNWFERVRRQNIPISGPMMQEQALFFVLKRLLALNCNWWVT